MDDIFQEANFIKAVNGLNFHRKEDRFHGDRMASRNRVDELTKQQIESNGTEINKIPPFPIEVFPLPVQKIIKATNESLNFPTDFLGASILYAVSIAIGNTHRVKVKNGWQENVTLFFANVGRPNTNKSHPLSFALQPIIEKDKNAYIDYLSKKEEYAQAIKSTKKLSEKKNITEHSKPVWEKSLVTDFTPEALSEVHKNNSRGIGVYVDELAGWFKNFNRYRNGADQEFWLSVWSCKAINIDRKNSDPIFIPQPFISVGGNIPTGILHELAGDNRSQNGFIDRMLFAFPDGLEKPHWSETEIDSEIIDKWKEIISNLLTLELQLDNCLTPISTVLKFTPEAFQKLMKWEKENTDLCNQTENELLAGIYGKFDIHAVRFALILEMLQFACGESDKSQVGIVAVNGALQLVEYFQATARKVHSIISNDDPLAKQFDKYRKLYEALPDRFKTGEGHRVARELKVPPDTFNKWLKRERNKLFGKIQSGEYEKLV
jgi:hypothetical protein